MPRGLLFRRIVAVILILIFVAATIYSIAASFADPILFVAGAILGITGLVEPVSIIWDRFIPDPTTRRRKPVAAAVRDADAYLAGRLRQFEGESKLFVELAGDTIIQTTFSSEAHQFDNIQKAVELHKGRFVLIGEPGAGKSTSLRQLMIQSITDYRLRTNPRLPVWINLGLSGTPINADDLLQFWWDEQAYLPGTPDQHIKNDAVWFFMDGLNEMPLDSREERAQALKAFLDKHPTLPVIVTCRVRDYEDDEKLNLGLPMVRVHELDEGRIQEFINKRGASADLWGKIRSNDALRRMADNPYKLVMLIAVYQARRELPERLDELYGLYVTEAYRTYKNEREKLENTSLLHLTWPKLEARLKRLAFLMIKDGKGTAASVEWAQHKIGKRALMDGINLGVLVVDGEDAKFYHQSLHGFFAVEKLSMFLNRASKSLLGLVPSLRLISKIGELGESGRPAISSLVKIMDETDRDSKFSFLELKLVSYFGVLVTNRKLAQIEETMEYPSENKKWPRLKQHEWNSLLKEMGLAEGVIKLVQFSAIDALVKVASDDAVIFLKNYLHYSEPLIKAAAIMSLATIEKGKAVEDILTLVDDPNIFVRGMAVEALGEIGDYQVVSTLIKRLSDIQGTATFRVCDSAAHALRKIGTPEALAAVEQWEREQKSGG